MHEFNPVIICYLKRVLLFYGQVLATICEELPPDGVLFIYLSASGQTILMIFKIMEYIFFSSD